MNTCTVFVGFSLVVSAIFMAFSKRRKWGRSCKSNTSSDIIFIADPTSPSPPPSGPPFLLTLSISYSRNLHCCCPFLFLFKKRNTSQLMICLTFMQSSFPSIENSQKKVTKEDVTIEQALQTSSASLSSSLSIFYFFSFLRRRHA